MNSYLYLESNGAQSVEVKADGKAGSMIFRAPVRTVSEANWSGPLRVKMKRKRDQRTVFSMLVKPHVKPAQVKFPCTVRLTRYAKGRTPLDDDNLRSAMKHVRDGVADGLGRDDSAKSQITWEYLQLTGQSDYGVSVMITWGGK